MKRHYFFSYLAVAAMLVAGCDDSQSVDEPAEEAAADHTVTVSVDGHQTGSVNLKEMNSQYQDVEYKGDVVSSVRLSDIVAKANDVPNSELEAYLAGYNCVLGAPDFLSTDRGVCREKGPFSCTELLNAYVSVAGHKVFGDDGSLIASAGCYGVNDFDRILLTMTTAEGGDEGGSQETTKPESYDEYKVKVVKDGAEVGEVDIATLKDRFVDKDGEDIIYAGDIIHAVLPDFNLEEGTCDYVGSDGWRPSDDKSGGCQETRSCTFATSSYIALADTAKRKLVSEEGDKCYNVKYFSVIEITTDAR